MLTSAKAEMRFQKGAADGEIVEYPCVLETISKDTHMVNPCDGVRHGIPEPHRPGSAEYDEEADALVRLAMDVERDIWPEWYWEFVGVDSRISPVLRAVGLCESNPKGCADSVQMDQPEELWAAIIRYARDEGVPLETGLPGQRFLERHVSPLKVYADRVDTQMEKAFEAKYFFGQPRPEEYENSPNFAHYPEGCPNHPSYPAGHGTFAGAANWGFNQVFPDAPMGAVRDVRTATLQLAHFRDMARVHNRQDSRVGWEFGNDTLEVT